ncbi:hypothetical protein IAT40_001349 [Kwoniella sp. CBS 6097]
MILSFLLAGITYFSSLIIFASIVSYFFPSFAQPLPHNTSIPPECDVQAEFASYPALLSSTDGQDVEGYHIPGSDHSDSGHLDRQSYGGIELELKVEGEVEMCASRLPPHFFSNSPIPMTIPSYQSTSMATSPIPPAAIHIPIPLFIPVPIPILTPFPSVYLHPADPLPQNNVLPFLRWLLSASAAPATGPENLAFHPRTQVRRLPIRSSEELSEEADVGRPLRRYNDSRRNRRRRRRRFHPYKRVVSETDTELASIFGNDHQMVPALNGDIGHDWREDIPSPRTPATRVVHASQSRRNVPAAQTRPEQESPRKRRWDDQEEAEVTPPLECIARGYKPIPATQPETARSAKKVKVDKILVDEYRPDSTPAKGTIYQRRRTRSSGDVDISVYHSADPDHPAYARVSTSIAGPSPELGLKVGTNIPRSTVRLLPGHRVKSPRSARRSPRLISASISAISSASSKRHQSKTKRSRPRSLSPLEHAQRGQNKRRRLTRIQGLALYRPGTASSISQEGTVSPALGYLGDLPSALPTPGLSQTGTCSSDEVGGQVVLITPTTDKMTINQTHELASLRSISDSGASLTKTPGSMNHVGRKDAPAPLTLASRTTSIKHSNPPGPGLATPSPSPLALATSLAGLTEQERAEILAFVSQYPDGLDIPTGPQTPYSPVSPASSRFPIASPPVSPVSSTFPTDILSAKATNGFRRAGNGSRRRESTGLERKGSSEIPTSGSDDAAIKAKHVSDHRLKKYRRLLYHLNMPPSSPSHRNKLTVTDALQSRRYDLIVQLLTALGMTTLPTTFWDSVPSPKLNSTPLPLSSTIEGPSSPLRSQTQTQTQSKPEVAATLAYKKTFVNISEPINVLARYLEVDHLSPRERRRTTACLDAYAAWRRIIQRRVERKLDAALSSRTNVKAKPRNRSTPMDRAKSNNNDRALSVEEDEGEDEDGAEGGWYDLAVAHMAMTTTTTSIVQIETES